MSITKRRLGRLNHVMQRVDAGYLYELGDAVRRLRGFKLREVPAYEIWNPLAEARTKLADFLEHSVYSQSLRGIHPRAAAFLEQIDELQKRMVTEKLEKVTVMDQGPLQDAYERFEPAFATELSNQVVFLVSPKGAYDVVVLVENGSQLFPQSVHIKAPDAAHDVGEGAKCMAFELWTAAAFHFHRANEAVLRRYFDHCLGTGDRPDPCTMGTMLRNLDQRKAGDPQVIVALQNITKFHRNPISHPGQFVDDSEQAFSLVAAIRAVMGYMLDALPIFPLDELMAGIPNPELAEMPLLDAKASD